MLRSHGATTATACLVVTWMPSATAHFLRTSVRSSKNWASMHTSQQKSTIAGVCRMVSTSTEGGITASATSFQAAMPCSLSPRHQRSSAKIQHDFQSTSTLHAHQCEKSCQRCLPVSLWYRWTSRQNCHGYWTNPSRRKCGPQSTKPFSNSSTPIRSGGNRPVESGSTFGDSFENLLYSHLR